mmetsp:Transcript_8547/g.12590  ORF Transcript_8547/g.12590 Transcript_8547/m.12590 type:complete len:265 (-) Transcript_8547:57-851(-)
MVFFSCDRCGEMLKKAKVDVHARRCGCESVSCVDCSVKFWGDDYRAHTSCISEAERYEKTIYKGPRKNDTKGRKLTPQESWMEIINESLTSSCPPSLSSHLQNLSSLDNVPRKEKAFRNFASNSLGLRGQSGDAAITSIWKHLISARQEKLKAKEEQEKAQKEAKENSTPTKTDKEEDTSSSTTKNSNEQKIEKSKSKKKSAVKAMKKALKKAPSKQLKVKELRKLVKAQIEAKDKDELKNLMADVIATEKSIIAEGKIVRLII